MRFATLLLLGWVFLALEAMAQPRVDLHGDPLPEGAIARLGSTRFQFPREAGAVALSPDGATIGMIHALDKGTRLVLLETSTGKQLRHFDLPGNFNGLHFTPDGKLLALPDGANIHLVDVGTGKVVRSIATDYIRENPVAFTADGSRVATQVFKGGFHSPVRLWDATTGKEVASLPGRGAVCKAVTFSPDGKRILLLSLVPTHADGVALGFDDRSPLAAVSIDVSKGKILGEVTTGSSHAVALATDGETVALETADRSAVCVRHLPTGVERIVIPTRQSRFAFGPDGTVLFSVAEDGKAALWNVAKGEKIRDLEGAVASKSFDITGISKDGRTVAILEGGWRVIPRLVVWDATTGRRVGRPIGHEDAITCIAYSPGGKVLASGSLDRTVRLWNPTTGEHLRSLPEHREGIVTVAISPDGQMVASSCRAGLTRLCNVADGKMIDEFNGPVTEVSALAFSADSTWLSIGGDGAQVLSWDIANKKQAGLVAIEDFNRVVAFGGDGTLALVASSPAGLFGGRALGARSRLQARNLKTGQSAILWLPRDREPEGRQTANLRCEAAMMSPEGRLVATSQVSEFFGIRPSYGEAKLRLWDRTSGQLLHTLAPTVTPVLAFSPTGRLLASGSPGESGHQRVGYGDRLGIWDTLTGAHLGELPTDPEVIAFSPNGQFLATAGRYRNVLIWNVPQPKAAQNPKVPTAAERDAWWTTLAGDAKDAHRTIGEMATSPEAAVALIRERIHPIPASDSETLARLIVQLDSDRFDEREKAQKTLEKLGEGAASFLTKTLQGKVSPEVRRRLEAVLTGYEAASMSVQQDRAFAALEWIGTPAARAVLQSLADGAPGARRTIDARAALKRLSE